MAFKVVETIIQNKLILTQQTEQSKNYYIRFFCKKLLEINQNNKIYLKKFNIFNQNYFVLLKVA